MKQEHAEQTDVPAGKNPTGTLFPCLWANMWSKPAPQKQIVKKVLKKQGVSEKLETFRANSMKFVFAVWLLRCIQIGDLFF